MTKTILMYVIVIAVVGVGVWLLVRKGSVPQNDLYASSPSPTASGSPMISMAMSPTPTSSGKMVTTSDGLQYQDQVVGTGSAVKVGDTINVLYTGMLSNGTVFDSSALHGGTPFSVQIGVGQVIQGWDEGIIGMKAGGTRKLIIPAALGYGAQANGPIPANSQLIFTVQLVSIGAPAATQ